MNAIIGISGEINQEVSECICEDFLSASKDSNVEQIVFLIASGGGKTDIVPTLWEFVKMSSKPVCAIGTSRVCSTAASIFMMAPRRILLPNVEFLLHKSARGLNGSFTVDELKKILDESKKMNEVFFAPVLANSKISKKVLDRKTQRCNWVLTEYEITKYGITTESYNIEEVKKLLMED